MNDLIPYYRPGQDITCEADGTIHGKRFVSISDTRTSGPGLSDTAEGSNYVVAESNSGDIVLGAAKYDAANGGKVGVVLMGSIVPITAGEGLSAGEFVQPDADGKAVSGGNAGLCMADATNNTDAQILLLPPAPPLGAT